MPRSAKGQASPGLIASNRPLNELDYLLATHGGQREELKLLHDVGRGVYELQSSVSFRMTTGGRLVHTWRRVIRRKETDG